MKRPSVPASPPLPALATILALVFALPLAAPAEAGRAEGTVPSSDGVPIHYVTQGSGTPALVFIHGWSGDLHIWDEPMERFAPRAQVVAIDLAGHGGSGSARKVWEIPAFGRDVKAVVEKLGLSRVILVGHSMGGSVIVEAALLMPDRVVLLVPVDSLHDVGARPTDEQREEFLAPFRKDFAGAADVFIRRFFPAGTDAALVDRIAKGASAGRPEVLIPCLEGLFRYDLPGALARVRAPIHAINSDGYPTNLEGNRRHAARFEVTLMPGTGHFPMLVKPGAFDEILGGLMEKGTQAAPAP